MRRDNPGKQSATTRGWGTLSGIEPEKGKGTSSPGMYEASLMWPRNHQSGTMEYGRRAPLFPRSAAASPAVQKSSGRLRSRFDADRREKN
jgi:hypothetical protein